MIPLSFLFQENKYSINTIKKCDKFGQDINQLL